MQTKDSKSALVTGASKGIGLAIARELAGDGYSLTIAARNPEPLEKAAAGLRELGVGVAAVVADVTSEEAICKLAAAHAAEHEGRLDLLVNNAGMGILGPVETLSLSHMDLQYRINLRSVAIAYRECVGMLERAAELNGSATVVNVSSISGKLGERDLSFYTAVKHGVVGFTKAMNVELQERGIKSCALCPGFVDTELSDYTKSSVPAEEMIEPRDLGRAVAFLASLSRYCVVPEIVLQRLGDELQIG
jgi:NAD(P)-dependent dehydrogenase (short-subunit alcohol dehydrogenase family)